MNLRRMYEIIGSVFKQLKLVWLIQIFQIIFCYSNIMASSSKGQPKKEWFFRVELTDDEDDDFKPLVLPPKTDKKKTNKIRDTERNYTTFKSGNKSKGIQDAIPEKEAMEVIKEEEIIISGVAEEDDDVAVLFSTKCGAFNEGKSAWKNLMQQMQKNQKGVGTNTKVGKKVKSVPKRSLILSPQSKEIISKAASSPFKKSPRLCDDDAIKISSNITATNQGRTKVDDDDLCYEVPDIVNGNQSNIDSESVICSNGINPKEESCNIKTLVNVAPIFLSVQERKALMAAKSQCRSELLLDSLVHSSSEFSSTQTEFQENPEHFCDNRVVLNDFIVDKDPYNGTKTKVCPFYKKLPDVPFCVDAFNYGLIPGMEVYFLSHFHSDHYIGLSKKFCKTVICSFPTGNLVRMKLYVEEKCIRKLNLNKAYVICGSEVTLIDANHCPGSVMFIFRLKNGKTILHNGDFRYTRDMFDNPLFSDLEIDSLYLDTTYCSPEYDFPTQTESISNIIESVKQKLAYRPKTLILCGSYLIGKERVYFSLAEAIGTKVFAPQEKRKIINALANPMFSSLLSSDEKSCKIHVVNMNFINAQYLKEYLSKYEQYSNIIGIKPSGWQFSSAGSGCSVKCYYGDTVTILGVPYSEHSNFSELREFVTRLKPKRVQPTVNVGNPKKRSAMMKHIESWQSVYK